MSQGTRFGGGHWLTVCCALAVTLLSAMPAMPGVPEPPAFRRSTDRTPSAMRALTFQEHVARSLTVTPHRDGAPRRSWAAADPLTLTPSAPRSLTLAFTGDLLTHGPIMHQAQHGDRYDFSPMLAEVAPIISRADLALCHLEVPLSRDNTALSSYPVFNAPRELADAIVEAGYDGCSVASNHAFDRGESGVAQTLGVLDDAGLGHAGTARRERESRQVRSYRANDVRVAHLSYTYGLNGFRLPEDRPWMVNLIDGDRIVQEARRARRQDADVVIVSLHWGVEYVSEPTTEQRSLAERLLTEPAIDLLVGHHAHVVQPIEEVRERIAIFGLGNFLSNQSAACCPAATQDGVIVEVTVEEQGDSFVATEVAYTPTYVEHPSYRVLPVPQTLEDQEAPSELRAQLKESLARTTAVIGTEARLANR